jgi:hypothetical protein
MSPGQLTRHAPIRRRARRDPVSPELRIAVLERDGGCVLWRLDPSHWCRDQWGLEHNPELLEVLTVEHVKSDLRMGVRAPSDLAHLVAMCHSGNVGVPSKSQRQALRAYLEEVS